MNKKYRVELYDDRLIELARSYRLADVETNRARLVRSGDVFAWITYRDRHDYVGILFSPASTTETFRLPPIFTFADGVRSDAALLAYAAVAASAADYPFRDLAHIDGDILVFSFAK